MTTKPQRRTPAPAGLSTRGKRYWKQTTDTFELTDSETQLLLEVCRTLDQLDALAAAVAADGPMVVGSQGQPVVHPGLTEARGQRAILHRLIAALRLPDEDGAAVPTGRQIGSVASNRARWAGHRKEA